MAEFLIPRTVPKFAGAPLTALDPDDLRYILRHARRDRLLVAGRGTGVDAPRSPAPSPPCPGTPGMSGYQPINLFSGAPAADSVPSVHPPPAAPEGVPWPAVTATRFTLT